MRGDDSMEVRRSGKEEMEGGMIVSSSSTTGSGGVLEESNRVWMLEAEVEALQKDLDHERSVRKLENRRVERMERRWKNQIEFLTQSEEESRQLLEDIIQRNEADLEICQQARREALERCTQAEQKLLLLQQQQSQQSQQHTDQDDSMVELERNKRRLIETKCDTLEKEIESLQATIEEMSACVSTTTTPTKVEEDSTDTSTSNQVKKRKLSSHDGDGTAADEESSLQKELNELRVQLAQTQRSNRQWIRKASEASKKANEALHYQQSSTNYQQQVETLQTEKYQLLQRIEEHSILQDQWKQFSHALRSTTPHSTNQNTQTTATTTTQSSSMAAPPEVATVLRSLQTWKDKHQTLTTSFDATKLQYQAALRQIAHLEHTSQQLTQTHQTLQTSHTSLQQTFKQTQDQLTTIQAQQAIWKKEANSMRSLLHTYEQMEQNITSSSSTNSTNKDTHTSATTASLQLTLDSTKEELQLLTQQNQQILEEKNALIEQADKDKEEHTRVLNKFEKLKQALYAEREKAQVAEQRAMEAETAAGKGAYNTDTTKVLHLQSNPLTNAIHDKYNAEIAQLQSTIEALKHNPPPSNTTNNNTNNTNEQSSSSSVDAQKLHQRLKKQFREQIASFREGVYLLTGYKIEMSMDQTTKPRFKVRSMYSDQEEDHLLFQWDVDSTNLDILSTDMAKLLSREPSFDYLSKYDSLPAFLASVTLSLFEKQTFVS